MILFLNHALDAMVFISKLWPFLLMFRAYVNHCPGILTMCRLTWIFHLFAGKNYHPLWNPAWRLAASFRNRNIVPFPSFSSSSDAQCIGKFALSLARPWLPDGKIWSLPFLGLCQGGGRGQSFQGMIRIFPHSNDFSRERMREWKNAAASIFVHMVQQV